MKIGVDTTADAMYIELADRSGKVARTVSIDDGTMCDLDAEGHLLGIEVIGPGRFWPLAEILARYEVSRDDQAMIMAMYPYGFSVQVA